MVWSTKIDAQGHEVKVNNKPVYTFQQSIKELRLKRSYLLIELEAVENEIVRIGR